MFWCDVACVPGWSICGWRSVVVYGGFVSLGLGLLRDFGFAALIRVLVLVGCLVGCLCCSAVGLLLVLVVLLLGGSDLLVLGAF